MSDQNTRAEKRTDNEQITDLRDLRRGDRVIVGDRTQPQTVVDLGERHHGRGDQGVVTPLVRVRGEWDGAVDVVLTHVSKRLGDDHASVVYEEQEQIVACEGGDLENGDEVDVERVVTDETAAACEVAA